MKPLIVFDSPTAFPNATRIPQDEIRRHMKRYRHLAALGATTLIIHHRSDKGEEDYPGEQQHPRLDTMDGPLRRPLEIVTDLVGSRSRVRPMNVSSKIADPCFGGVFHGSLPLSNAFLI